MPDSPTPKGRAANAAATLVESKMFVGLGSGSTAALVVEALGSRVREEGLRFIGVATSEATSRLAKSHGIELRPLNDVDSLDLCLDGADEIDPQFRMIKGRGGALLREKIIASVARRRVTVISPEKRVEQLGIAAPIPVEVSSLGTRHIETRLITLGARPTLRRTVEGVPFVTDGGNFILDCQFAAVPDPDWLNRALKQTIGVFETGLFIELCDTLVVGHADSVEIIDTQATRLPSF